MINKNFTQKSTPQIFTAIAWLAAAAFFVSIPGFAWADADSGGGGAATTLGDMFCNLYTNTKPFGMIFQWAAYVGGCMMAIQGIHHFRMHTENAANNPLRHGGMLWFGAMCLLALPSAVMTVVNSLYGKAATGGGMDACSAGAASGGTTLDVMLTSFVGNIYHPMIYGLSALSIVCGLFMMVRGFMKAGKYGIDPRTHSIPSILANIVFGALLFTVGDNLPLILGSLFGTQSITDPSSISWSFATALAGGASTQFNNAIAAALHFVQIIGVISFIRGWLIMKKVVEGGGQATMAQGITHILGGAAAINIALFVKILDATFGTNLLS